MIKALYKAYVDKLHSFTPDSDHETLLQVHSLAMCRSLRAMLTKDQTVYSFGFTGPEALAFMQWWGIVPVILGTLEHVTINQVIAAVDQVAKKPRKLLLSYE